MVAKNTSKKNDPLSNVVDFPDLPPRGSKSWGGGKRSLLGPEIGTQLANLIGVRDFSPITVKEMFLTTV